MFIVGVYDDFYNADFKLKFLLQIIVAKILIDQGLVINNFHGIFGIYSIGNVPSQLFTIFVFLVIVNAINFIDGIDGTLARKVDVVKQTPNIDGTIVDSVVDYLNYTIIPSLMIYWFQMVPNGFCLLYTSPSPRDATL